MAIPYQNYQSVADGNAICYAYKDHLGNGTFGSADVYASERSVVLKRVKLDARVIIQSPQLVKMVEREAMILQTLSHPNTVRIFHSWQENGYLVMELEYIGGGSLRKTIDEQFRIGAPFQLVQIKKWLLQLATGISYLHDLRVVHRDLKPDNVLLTKDELVVKISDFGIAKLTESARSATGSLPYIAPEAFVSEEESAYCAAPVDMWAYGVIAFELVAMEIPFSGWSMADFYRRYSKQNDTKPIKLDLIKSYSPELYDLIDTKLLVTDPSHRSTADQVLHHSFFAGIQQDPANCVQQQLRHLRDQMKEAESKSEAKIFYLEAQLKQSQDELKAVLEGLDIKSDYFRKWEPGKATIIYESQSPLKAVLVCGDKTSQMILIVHQDGLINVLSQTDWLQKDDQQTCQLLHHGDERLEIYCAVYDASSDDIYLTYKHHGGPGFYNHIGFINRSTAVKGSSSPQNHRIKLLIHANHTGNEIATASDGQLLFACESVVMKEISCWLIRSTSNGKSAKLLYSIDYSTSPVTSGPQIAAAFYRRNEGPNSSNDGYSWIIATILDAKNLNGTSYYLDISSHSSAVQGDQLSNAQSLTRKHSHRLQLKASSYPKVICFDKTGHLFVCIKNRVEVYKFMKDDSNDATMGLVWQSAELVQGLPVDEIGFLAVAVNPKTRQTSALVIGKQPNTWVAMIQ